MKNIKYLVVLLCMTLGLANAAMAQIYSSECCFYAEEGFSDVRYVIKFDYSEDRLWIKTAGGSSTVRKNLARTEDFYEDLVYKDNTSYGEEKFEYDSYRSTSANEVYKRERKVTRYYNSIGWEVYSYVPGGRTEVVVKSIDYVAISKDKMTLIKWTEPKDNYEGKTQNMKYYKLIPKEDLLPKAVNYDFLD